MERNKKKPAVAGRKRTGLRRLTAAMLTVVLAALLTALFSLTVCAAGDDPMEVIDNLSEFVFGLIRSVGVILLEYVDFYVYIPSGLAASQLIGYRLLAALAAGLLLGVCVGIMLRIGYSFIPSLDVEKEVSGNPSVGLSRRDAGIHFICRYIVSQDNGIYSLFI